MYDITVNGLPVGELKYMPSLCPGQPCDLSVHRVMLFFDDYLTAEVLQYPEMRLS